MMGRYLENKFNMEIKLKFNIEKFKALHIGSQILRMNIN